MTNMTMPNGVAPAGDRYKIGAKGGKVAQAWQYVWDRLDAVEYKDAVALADEAAKAAGVMRVSVMSHLHRMAQEGVLDTRTLYGDTTVTKGGKTYAARRKRMHVRLPDRTEAKAA